MSKECMLSAFDNPFDYFTQFNDWNLYEKEKGTESCEVLARIAKITDDMTQNEVDEEIERAVDEIIKHDFLNIYTKVYRKST
jgi:hypothetical protein